MPIKKQGRERIDVILAELFSLVDVRPTFQREQTCDQDRFVAASIAQVSQVYYSVVRSKRCNEAIHGPYQVSICFEDSFLFPLALELRLIAGSALLHTFRVSPGSFARNLNFAAALFIGGRSSVPFVSGQMPNCYRSKHRRELHAFGPSLRRAWKRTNEVSTGAALKVKKLGTCSNVLNVSRPIVDRIDPSLRAAATLGDDRCQVGINQLMFRNVEYQPGCPL